MATRPPAVFSLASGLVFGGAKAAGSGPSKIEHRIGVQAPAEIIWEILANLEGWADWNPLYPRAEGELRIGSTLSLTLALPGEPPMDIQPVVQDWVPEEQIHWRLSLARGLIRSVRYIEIESMGPANCIISNGEIFQGLLGPSIARRQRRVIREGFTLMGEALAGRAEQLWQARGAIPTSRP